MLKESKQQPTSSQQLQLITQKSFPYSTAPPSLAETISASIQSSELKAAI
jgi:hypothetical protein